MDFLLPRKRLFLERFDIGGRLNGSWGRRVGREGRSLERSQARGSGRRRFSPGLCAFLTETIFVG